MSGALGGAYLNDPPMHLALPSPSRSFSLSSPSQGVAVARRCLVSPFLVSRGVALLVRCLAPAKAPFAGGELGVVG